jgi:uncharacterized protein (TIGR03437 family)
MGAQGTIATVAGGPSSSISSNSPIEWRAADSIAFDAAGNLYMGERQRLWFRGASSGTFSLLAEASVAESDGLPQFSDLQFDRNGVLWYLDRINRCVRRWSNGGSEPIVGHCGGKFIPFPVLPADYSVTSAGNLLIVDNEGRLYSFDVNARVEKLIGGTGVSGRQPQDGDLASDVRLYGLTSPVADSDGNVYFGLEKIWRLDARTGVLTTVLGKCPTCGATVGPADQVYVTDPRGLRFGPDGSLYYKERQYSDFRFRRLNLADMTVSAVVAQSVSEGLSITDFAVGRSGAIWILDNQQGRLFSVDEAGFLHAEEGTYFPGDRGPAISAKIFPPTGMALDASGNLYLASGAIRRIDALTGFISTPYGDGRVNPLPALRLAVNRAGVIFFVGSDGASSSSLYRLDPGAARPLAVLSPAGQPIPASDVAMDRDDSLVVASRCAVLRINSAEKTFRRIAGSDDCGWTGLGENATATSLGGILAIAPDGDRGVYISSDARILKVDSAGLLSVVAGDGALQDSGDGGHARLAQFRKPAYLALDEAGNLYVGDQWSLRIRRIAAADGSIQTVAGTGKDGKAPDGTLAVKASINGLLSMTMGAGVLYFAEEGDSDTPARIRAVAGPAPPAQPQPPVITNGGNAAQLGIGVSPGAWISIYGHYLGPANPLSGAPGPDGRMPGALGGVRVDGVAPLLYVSAGRVDAVLPGSLYCLVSHDLHLESPSGSARSALPCFDAALAFFPNSVYNQDGSPNDAAHPARPSSVVTLFGTGMGPTSPPGTDGTVVTGPDWPTPVIPFSAFVSTYASGGGVPAEVLYLGSAPNAIYGLVQANVRIPAESPTGLVAIFFQAGPGPGNFHRQPVGTPIFVSPK